MNRLIKLVIFTVLVAALGVTALAQDALALPAAAGAKNAPRNEIPVLMTYEPGQLSAFSPLAWTPVGAGEYKVTFKVVRTGEKIVWWPAFGCAPLCITYEYPMSLFAATRDGDTITARVTTKVDGVKYTSKKLTTIVNEVDAATLQTPADDKVIAHGTTNKFTWTIADGTTKQTLVIKNAKTGKVMLKYKVDINEDCSLSKTCTYSHHPENLPSGAAQLKIGKPYKWFVISKGVSGEKAKSMVNRFTMKSNYAD